MTLFIRNDKNQNIVSVDVIDNGKRVNIYVRFYISDYSKLLLNNIDRSEELANDFDKVNALNGRFWEYYKTITNHFDAAVSTCEHLLIPVANKYKLDYVVD